MKRISTLVLFLGVFVVWACKVRLGESHIAADDGSSVKLSYSIVCSSARSDNALKNDPTLAIQTLNLQLLTAVTVETPEKNTKAILAQDIRSVSAPSITYNFQSTVCVTIGYSQK